MKITKIEQQKNRQNRANLYIDNEFYVGINFDLVVSQNLYEGKDVDQVFLNTILEQEEFGKALNKSFDYLSRRQHSEKELRTKMRGKFTYQVINKVITRLKELSYIDDKKFAAAWFEARSKTRGPRVIKQELILKGVEKTIIEKIFDEGFGNEVEVAKSLVEKRQWPDMTQQERFQKIGGYLARRGFDYDVIKQVLNTKEE